MNDDAALLRRYADEGSEAAFTELVQRHVNLVYGAALRRTGGDAHRASDVAQQVFTALARKARALSQHAVLVGWLHTATRNAALNLMISEQRRKTRELESLDVVPAAAGDETGIRWEQVRPVIDAAIDELPEDDRAAVILRFLEHRPFAEVGAALHVTEDAARVRTTRALDKLRARLAHRGVTSTAAALGTLVAGQPLISAPTGLAAALATHSLASVAAGAGVSVTLLSIMNLKIVGTVALSAFVFFALGSYVGVSYVIDQPLPAPEAPHNAELIASLRGDNLQLRAEVDRLNAVNAKLVAPRPAPAPVVSAPPPVSPAIATLQRTSIQKAMLNNLRQIAAARDQFILENSRAPYSLDELVGETKYIRALVPVNGENYASLSLLSGQALTVITPDGTSVTYDPSGNTSTRLPEPSFDEQAAQLATIVGPKVGPSLLRAAAAYRAANGDTPPKSIGVLLPYFATPQEGVDFVQALDAVKAGQH